MTSPPPVFSRYKLVMYGPCVCFTSIYVKNLPATHAFVVVWRFACTFCHPSLASYGVSHFLASHSLGLAPFGGWAFAWLWAFPSSAYSLALFCSLCVSCHTALLFLLWYYLTQACWASLGLLLILLSITQYSHLGFLVTLLVGSCVPFSF